FSPGCVAGAFIAGAVAKAAAEADGTVSGTSGGAELGTTGGGGAIVARGADGIEPVAAPSSGGFRAPPGWLTRKITTATTATPIPTSTTGRNDLRGTLESGMATPDPYEALAASLSLGFSFGKGTLAGSGGPLPRPGQPTVGPRTCGVNDAS